MLFPFPCWPPLFHLLYQIINSACGSLGKTHYPHSIGLIIEYVSGILRSNTLSQLEYKLMSNLSTHAIFKLALLTR